MGHRRSSVPLSRHARARVPVCVGVGRCVCVCVRPWCCRPCVFYLRADMCVRRYVCAQARQARASRALCASPIERIMRGGPASAVGAAPNTARRAQRDASRQPHLRRPLAADRDVGRTAHCRASASGTVELGSTQGRSVLGLGSLGTGRSHLAHGPQLGVNLKPHLHRVTGRFPRRSGLGVPVARSRLEAALQPGADSHRHCHRDKVDTGVRQGGL